MKTKVIFITSIISILIAIIICRQVNKINVSLSIQEVINPNEAIFKLTNNGLKDIYFTGYGPDYPLTLTSSKVNSQWRHGQYPWCGTGQSTEKLTPGQSVTFTKSVDTNCSQWYIKLHVYPQSYDNYLEWQEKIYRFLNIDRAIAETAIQSPTIGKQEFKQESL